MRTGLGMVRDAAYKLSRRRTSEIELEDVVKPLDLFSELSDQISRAAAKQPGQLKILLRMLEDMEELVRTNRFDLYAGSIPKKNIGPASLTINGFSFDLALQVILSLCRNIVSAEADSAPMEWAVSHYGREFERSLPWTSAFPSTLGDLEGNTADHYPRRVRTYDLIEGKVRSRFQDITTPAFVQQMVYPAVFGELQHGLLPDSKAIIVHEPGSGRITVCYTSEGKPLAYGKLYSDEAEALHSSRVLNELWKKGFDSLSLYRVPQPLAYFPEYKLQLTRAAEGEQLSALLAGHHAELTSYARQAARWLVKLHMTPVRLGRRETIWESMDLLRLIRRISRAAASAPEQRSSLLEMVKRLSELGRKSLKAFPQVQSHGTFHPDHVLVNGPITTVMDFDRSVPSDPAKDLADFLKILRLKSFLLTGDTRVAEEPSKTFLQEYMRHLPENCDNLSIYWAAYNLSSLLGRARKSDLADEAFDRKMRYLADEFDLALSGKLIPATPPRGEYPV